MIQDAANRLGEHFSSVQILVSWPNEKGGTKSCKKGYGDWYARQGLAREFINEDVANEHAIKIAEKLEPPPDDSWKQTA